MVAALSHTNQLSSPSFSRLDKVNIDKQDQEEVIRLADVVYNSGENFYQGNVLHTDWNRL